MGFMDWYNKNFNKGKIYIVYRINKDGTVDEFISKRTDDIHIKVGKKEKQFSYEKNREKVSFMKGIPTFFTYSNSAKVLDPKNLEDMGEVTADELNQAVESKVVSDLLKAGKNDNHEMIGILVSAVAVIGIAYVGYEVMGLIEMVTEQQEIIYNLEEMIKGEVTGYGSSDR